MNPTQEKFGDPHTRVQGFDHWVVVVRPQQITLGSLVLINTESATAFSKLSSKAFSELRPVTEQLEQALNYAFAYDRLNYLMLMMEDPNVHFHVLPRYADSRTFAGRTFHDPAWPGPPDLGHSNTAHSDTEVLQALLKKLKSVWGRRTGSFDFP